MGTLRGSVLNLATDQQALVASLLRYKLLAENASDILCHTDPDSVVQWVSPSVSRVLGWEPAQLVGSNIIDLIHPDDLESKVAAREAISQESSSVYEARYRAVDGTYRWFSVVSRPIFDNENKTVGQVSAARDITDEREVRERLEYQAFHDMPTGLHNRVWVLDILEKDLSAAQRSNSIVAVLFIDLDQFKVVNDSLGHVAGDEMLLNIAARITSALRAEDRIGRFGGDEFVVVLPSVNDPQEVEHVAQRITTAVGAEQDIQGRRIVTTTSIGIALSRSTSTAESLLRDADSALFRAKNAGRNRWQFFDNDMHVEALARLTLEEELRHAIAGNEFQVFYQPIVDLSDARIIGHEALLRWMHPTRGLLAPDVFLSVAEDNGLIVEIGRQVLDQVCEMLSAHTNLEGPISVNVSAKELTEGNWLAGFTGTLNRHGVDPGWIIVEVTETAAFHMGQDTRQIFKELEALGVGLHLDDFGTGFSSISLLRDLPITGVKLDRSFVANLTQTGSASDALAVGLGGLVNGLNLTGIAEGIETAKQAHFLQAIGWAHGQGYYYGRPASKLAETSPSSATPPPEDTLRSPSRQLSYRRVT